MYVPQVGDHVVLSIDGPDDSTGYVTCVHEQGSGHTYCVMLDDSRRSGGGCIIDNKNTWCVWQSDMRAYDERMNGYNTRLMLRGLIGMRLFVVLNAEVTDMQNEAQDLCKEIRTTFP